MIDASRHLTDGEIVTRVDEPDRARDERIEAHLAACEPCRARVTEMEELFAFLGAEPPAALEIELAARRDRILAAVAARPRRSPHGFPRRTIWVPLAAAAAIAALVIGVPRLDRSPVRSARLAEETGTTRSAPAGRADTALAVVVEASRAAEEVLQAVGDTGEIEPLVETPPLDGALPEASALALGYDNGPELESDFAALPTEDREAILDELARTRFDL